MMITVRDVCSWSKFNSFTTPKHYYNYNYNSPKLPRYYSISICRSSLSLSPKPNSDLHSNRYPVQFLDFFGFFSGVFDFVCMIIIIVVGCLYNTYAVIYKYLKTVYHVENCI